MHVRSLRSNETVRVTWRHEARQISTAAKTTSLFAQTTNNIPPSPWRFWLYVSIMMDYEVQTRIDVFVVALRMILLMARPHQSQWMRSKSQTTDGKRAFATILWNIINPPVIRISGVSKGTAVSGVHIMVCHTSGCQSFRDAVCLWVEITGRASGFWHKPRPDDTKTLLSLHMAPYILASETLQPRFGRTLRRHFKIFCSMTGRCKRNCRKAHVFLHAAWKRTVTAKGTPGYPRIGDFESIEISY